MRTSLAAAALAAVPAVQATVPEGVVKWDIGRRQPHPRVRRRASDTDSTTIKNDLSLGGYFATCKVGTPAQTLTLQLDTGSSDIWVPSSSASVCSSSRSSSGCTLGSFNSDDSSTFEVVGEDEFSISYVDGSKSQGSYISDVFTIGESTVTNMTMGLGESTDISFGVIGVGYKTDEAIVSTEQSFSASYNNLPLVLTSEGIIKSTAYSLWLNDLDASSGTILFGGIDTDKYQGSLIKVDVQKDADVGTITSFIVDLTALSAVSSSGTDTLSSTAFPVPVVLDSGTTLSYLPQDLAEQVWKEVGAEYDAQAGLALVACSRASSAGYFSFGFGGTDGAVVNVTMDELVLDLGGTATFTSGSLKGQAACEFGIQNATSAPYLLGDTFLRSAYVVYDLVNNEIGLAQTDFNATSSNIVAFASSGAPIPSATAAPSQAAVSAAAATASPAFAAASGFSSASSGSGSSNAAAGLSVPAGLGLGLVVATLFLSGGLLVL